MWKVLRRLQGEAYDEPETSSDVAAEQRLRDNLRIIATHECKPNPEPHAPTVLTEAYADGVYPKILRTLKDPNVVLRIKALQMLQGLVELKKENIVKAARDGLVAGLVAALQDGDSEVRLLSANCLYYMMRHDVTIGHVVRGNFVPSLLAAVSDSSPHVRAAMLRVLAAMNRPTDNVVTQELIRLGCVPVYLRQIDDCPDDDNICSAALIALTKVLSEKEAFIAVLDAHGMDTLGRVVHSDSIPTRQPETFCDALEAIAQLAFYTAGKRAAVRVNVLPSLSKILSVFGTRLLSEPSDATMDVCVACTGAVMAIAIDDAGKKLTYECGIFGELLRLIGDDVCLMNTSLLVNVMELLCILSENPQAREEMKPLVERIESIEAISQEQRDYRVERACRRCRELINWKPGDVR
eukprot:PhM_4_TR6281/c0_g1_i2/m.93872